MEDLNDEHPDVGDPNEEVPDVLLIGGNPNDSVSEATGHKNIAITEPHDLLSA